MRPERDYTVSDHALQQLKRRSISREQLENTLARPAQKIQVTNSRVIYQSILEDENRFLLRVVVDTGKVIPVVVTAYRTSKIAKYWRTEDEN